MIEYIPRFADGVLPPFLARFPRRLDHLGGLLDDFATDFLDATGEQLGGVGFLAGRFFAGEDRLLQAFEWSVGTVHNLGVSSSADTFPAGMLHSTMERLWKTKPPV